MGLFDSLFHSEKPYQKAQEQLDKYYQLAQGYQQPYSQNGQEAYSQLSPAMQQLLNPEELQNKWAQGYEESPYAKMLQEMAQNQGLEAASSMGLMGSTPAIQGIQAGTARIGAADRQQYMNDLMQKLQAGIGLGQNIYGTGAQAAGQMGQNAMNMGQNSAQAAYGEASAPGALFGNLLGGAAGLAGSALGGPIGGVLASGLAQKMGWPQNQTPWSTGGGSSSGNMWSTGGSR